MSNPIPNQTPSSKEDLIQDQTPAPASAPSQPASPAPTAESAAALNPTAITATPDSPATPAAPTVSGDVYALLEKYGMDTAQAFDLTSRLGIEAVEDFQMLTETDLVGAGMKMVQARKLLASIKPAPVTPAPAAAPRSPAVGNDFGSILPVAPTNESWLKALKAGGVLKVGTEAYISAIRVVFASKVGLYDLPEKIADAMERFADETDAPVPDEFYRIRRDITRHNYGEIFAAIDGLDGSYVTDKRRKEFLNRVNTTLWPAIREAYVALNGWRESVKAVNSDISNLVDVFSSMMAGGGAMTTALPPFDSVQDASETLKDAINHVFRGVGGPVAAAMAYDAEQTAGYLENPVLPQLLGVANRDQMLKKLGANVSPNYARQEAYVVRFVLSFVKFSDNIAAGDEPRYLNALWQLGNMINWESLGVSAGSTSFSGIGGQRML